MDKFTRADVNCIHYECKIRHANLVIYILGKVNLTDTGTNTDSPLTQAFVLSMPSDHVSIDLSATESRCHDRPLGKAKKGSSAEVYRFNQSAFGFFVMAKYFSDIRFCMVDIHHPFYSLH